jgi:hypothetical protein
MITIETHFGIKVLRDDLLLGGTKSILMPSIIGEAEEYVYASPVYGGFQIALSAYCQSVNKKATIFCAKRKDMHPNTKQCLAAGANIIEVKCGYLSVVEKHAKDYCLKTRATKLEFGAKTTENKILIGNRVREVINAIGHEPKEIFCAIGSGTLVESILQSTETAQIYGIAVGKEYNSQSERLTVIKHHLSFDKESKFVAKFKSMPNYDLKAFEYCVKYKNTDDVLFWNVL